MHTCALIRSHVHVTMDLNIYLINQTLCKLGLAELAPNAKYLHKSDMII